VGKPFKPALRAEATREAVAEALRDMPTVTGVRGVVENGTVVAVVGLARGADQISVTEVLNRFALTWRLELS
jgi:fatty-acyl-CoA synthase